MSVRSRTVEKVQDRRRNVPTHLAVIPDGNRRYARKAGISEAEAHSQGADKVELLLDWCLDLGIKYVTTYAFSKENFNRPEPEKEALMEIYSLKFRQISEDDRIHDNEVRVRAIGSREEFPGRVVRAIEEAERATEDYDNFHLTVAIGYGGRAEIVDAARRVLEAVGEEEMSPGEVDEDSLSSFMYAPDVPEPDLVVRTSGERRLSGFLTWHVPDSKLHFSEKYWPEFEKEDLIEAVEAWRESLETGR